MQRMRTYNIRRKNLRISRLRKEHKKKMNSNKIIRITGMVITVISFLLATPLLLLSLLSLIFFQGIGGLWVAALHIITVTAIIASFPIIFTGFIMKYKLKVFIYLIIASLLLTALDLAIINGYLHNIDYPTSYYAPPQSDYYMDTSPFLFLSPLYLYFYYRMIVLAAIIFSIPALIYLIGWYLNRSNAEKPKMQTA